MNSTRSKRIKPVLSLEGGDYGLVQDGPRWVQSVRTLLLHGGVTLQGVEGFRNARSSNTDISPEAQNSLWFSAEPAICQK